MIEAKKTPERGDASYDLVIVGGGINGAGIARDAALRGLRVLLAESGDFGQGTSSASTRLIHGGLRYLEYAELSLVRESLVERRRLLRNAPHLVRPLCLTIPVYRGARRGLFLIRLGMLAYDLMSFGKELPRHRMLSRKKLLAAEPGLNPAGLLGGAQYYDAQVALAERLVIENVIAASRAGAVVRNYSEVVALERCGDSQLSVTLETGSGNTESCSAPVVVNAAGPWVDAVLARSKVNPARLMGGTKGSHIVVTAFSNAPRHGIYVEAGADGRPVFILPWNGQYLVGTTDIRFSGDPSMAQASDEEIDYLLRETNRVFPGAQLSSRDIAFAYAGIRPLPRQDEGPESAITRKHIIRIHDGELEGLISVIGGKLTTFRNLSEQVVDTVQQKLGQSRGASQTRDTPLPGADSPEHMSQLAARLKSLSPAGRQRVTDIYGGRVATLVDLCRDDAQWARPLDERATVLAAEVALACREEFAQTLTDLHYRRLMTGLSAHYGPQLLGAIADVAAAELDWDAATRRRQLAGAADYASALRRSETWPDAG